MTENSVFRIGITDSGFGGLTMVHEFLLNCPEVEIIYFADLKNAPYGDKPKSAVQELVRGTADNLMAEGVSAILLACNTATSVAVESLRKHLPIPVFGMEPAIKPALSASSHEKVIVLATALTLSEDRFLSLKNKVDPMNRVVPISCPGLSDLIDLQKWDQALDYVKKILDRKDLNHIHNVVLGCTHYIILERKLKAIYPHINFFNGNLGTLNHIIHTCKIPNLNISKNDKNNEHKYFNFLDGKTETTSKQNRSSFRWKFLSNIDQEKNEKIANDWINEFQFNQYARAI